MEEQHQRASVVGIQWVMNVAPEGDSNHPDVLARDGGQNTALETNQADHPESTTSQCTGVELKQHKTWLRPLLKVTEVVVGDAKVDLFARSLVKLGLSIAL